MRTWIGILMTAASANVSSAIYCAGTMIWLDEPRPTRCALCIRCELALPSTDAGFLPRGSCRARSAWLAWPRLDIEVSTWQHVIPSQNLMPYR
jgi:hypothetical protein